MSTCLALDDLLIAFRSANEGCGKIQTVFICILTTRAAKINSGPPYPLKVGFLSRGEEELRYGRWAVDFLPKSRPVRSTIASCNLHREIKLVHKSGHVLNHPKKALDAKHKCWHVSVELQKES